MGSSGAYAIARTNDSVDSHFEADGTLVVKWDGQPTAVRSVTFSLLAANRSVLKTVAIDWYPVEARFDASESAGFVMPASYWAVGAAE